MSRQTNTSDAFAQLLPAFKRLAASMKIATAGVTKLGPVFSTIHDEITVTAFGPPRSAVDQLGDLVREDDD